MKENEFSTTPPWVTKPVEIPVAPVAEADMVRDAGAYLSYEQEVAASNLTGYNLISAGAGTGKSSVLVAKTRALAKLYPTARVLLISFTKKAAQELQDRIGKVKNIQVSTFHSISYSILRQHGGMTGYKVVDGATHASIIRKMIPDGSSITVEGIYSSLHQTDVLDSTVADISSKYLNWLTDHKLLTFDTMQLMCLLLLRSSEQILSEVQQQWEFILVDEFQDTDAVQAEILEKISSTHGNVTVVGDLRQSIYSFRGSLQGVMAKFSQQHAAQVDRLQVNYRCNPYILGLANRVMPAELPLKSATLLTNAMLPPEYLAAQDEPTEATGVVDKIKELASAGHQLKDMVILYRSSYAITSLVAELAKQQLPFVCKAALGDDELKEQLKLIRKLVSSTDDYLQVMSIHNSKGMEFNTVFLIGAYDGILPSSKAILDDEERRLLYVAVTRAKEQLYISYPLKSRNAYFNTPSRFLREVF